MRFKGNPFLHHLFPPFIFLFFALFYFPNALSKVYLDLGDGWSQFYSRLSFFKYSLQHHVFPLWNPFILCGAPCGLDPHSNYTLAHFLASFLSLHYAWNGTFIISAFLSGYLVFLSLEKNFLLNRDSAFLGGFIYLTLSVNVPMENPTFFLPLLFFLATQWLQTRRFYWVFLLSIANAWYFLSANPQFVIYSSIFFFVYILIFLRKYNQKRSWLFLLCETCLPFLLMLGLICFQATRVYQLLSISHRHQSVGGIMNVWFPTEFIGMIIPGYLNNSIDPTLNFLQDVMSKAFLSKFTPSLRLRLFAAPYVGILPLFLAFSFFFREKKQPVEKFFLTFIVCVLVYLIFNPLFFFVRYIPLLKDLPQINRIYLLYGFGMSLLAAFSFNSIDQCREKAQRLSRILMSFFIGFLVFLLVRLLIWGGVCAWESSLTAFSMDHILPVILKQKFYLASTDFYRARILQIIVYLKYWASPFNAIYANPVIVVTLVFFGFMSFLKGRLNRGVLFLLFFGVIFLDSFINLRPNKAYSAQSLMPLQKEANWILQNQGLFRVLPLQPPIDSRNPPTIDTRRLDTRAIILWPETNLLYPLQSPEGYRSLIRRRYVDFFQRLAKKDISGWRMGEIDDVDDYFADMANIKYFIVQKDTLLKQYPLIHETEEYRIFKNPDALERAYIVHRAEVLNDGVAVLERFQKKSVDLKNVILLEDSRSVPGFYGDFPDSAKGSESANITKYDANNMTIDAMLMADGFLVVTDSFDAGWKAYVDSREVPVNCANYIFKAVKVSKGKHQIQFRFEPPFMRRGLLIAIIAFLAGVLFSILDYLKSRKRP